MIKDMGKQSGDAKQSDFVLGVKEWLKEDPKVDSGILIYKDETGIHYVAGQIEDKSEAMGLLEFGKLMLFNQ